MSYHDSAGGLLGPKRTWEANMDIAMRDLEQIQEHSDTEHGRKLGLLGLGAVSLAGLFFAVTTAIGDSNAESASTPDPLARLSQREAIAAGAAPVEHPAPAAERLAREDLAFPTSLVDDPRAELARALASAAEEHANLAAAGQELPMPVAPIATQHAMPTSLPASIAAGNAARHFSRPTSGDVLIAAAAVQEDATPRASAPAGSDGNYTVQVISYNEAAEADAFAAALRARGHRAFVVSADVPNRGRLFRVRIGPFERLHDADAYRREFEAREHMNTLVVRRDRAASSAAE
jgi:DedD protein